MASIASLPYDIFFQITSYLDKPDLLQFRLVSPRSLLPHLNSLVFKSLTIPVDAADNLTRYHDAERDGFAIERLKEVAESKVVQHVRVLVLQLSRAYSIPAYYDMLDKQESIFTAPLINYSSRSKSPSWLSSKLDTFSDKLTTLISSKSQPPGLPSDPNTLTRNLTPQQYTEELAKGLQYLFSKTDLITTIRLAQPKGYNSPYDIVYPTIYARALIRLFGALIYLNPMPGSLNTLELGGLPLDYLEESGLYLDSVKVKSILTHFPRLSIQYRDMNYNKKFQKHVNQSRTSMGDQLLGLLNDPDGTAHITALSLRGFQPLERIISQPDRYPNLKHFKLWNVVVDCDTIAPFIANKLPQLITLWMIEVRLSKNGGSWKNAYEKWKAVKRDFEKDPKTKLPLEDLRLYSLVEISNWYHTESDELKSFIREFDPQRVSNPGHTSFYKLADDDQETMIFPDL